MRYAAALLIGLVIGLLVGRWHWNHPSYTVTRDGFVRLNVALAEPVDTLILGDSISESTWLDGVCGKTFNASVGGAKVENVRQMASLAIPKLKPSVIVVEAGTNDLGTGGSLDAFRRSYAGLVAALPRARMILVGVPGRSDASAFVRSLAQSSRAAYVEPAEGALTSDGIHPTTAGARVYRARLASACHAAENAPMLSLDVGRATPSRV